ncbi:MAG TPA: hypothetical protein VEI97_19170, partial [bacterium]|nr:hypothetical protein [bacterium]
TLRAGQRPDFQPYIFRLLAERGKWDEGPFVEQLRKGRYGAIALQSNLFEPGNREEPGQDPLGAGYDRFTPAMEEAIRSRYRLSNETPIFANGPWYLYVLR